MLKFLMCDLPMLMDIDWAQPLLDIDWFQALLDIDLLQVVLAVFPIVVIIGVGAALYTFVGGLSRLAVLFHKTAFLNEAGFHRPESPLWFALGP